MEHITPEDPALIRHPAGGALPRRERRKTALFCFMPAAPNGIHPRRCLLEELTRPLPSDNSLSTTPGDPRGCSAFGDRGRNAPGRRFCAGGRFALFCKPGS